MSTRSGILKVEVDNRVGWVSCLSFPQQVLGRFFFFTVVSVGMVQYMSGMVR